MSSVRFGAVYIDSSKVATWTLVAEGSVGYEQSVVLNFCNQANYVLSVGLAYIGDPLLSGPLPSDIMFIHRTMGVGESFSLPAIALSEVGSLVVRSEYVGLSVVAHGFRDPE